MAETDGALKGHEYKMSIIDIKTLGCLDKWTVKLGIIEFKMSTLRKA